MSLSELGSKVWLRFAGRIHRRFINIYSRQAGERTERPLAVRRNVKD